MALWNEQRFFTEVFDRVAMQQQIRATGSDLDSDSDFEPSQQLRTYRRFTGDYSDVWLAPRLTIDFGPWFGTVPRRYQPHVEHVMNRELDVAAGLSSPQEILRFVNKLHDALWAELVPIRGGTPTGWPQQAAPGTRRALDLLLDEVVVDGDGWLDLFENEAERGVIRVAVATEEADRVMTAVRFYLSPHIGAGIELRVDRGPAWQLPKTLHAFVRTMAVSIGAAPPSKVIADMIDRPLRLPLGVLTDEQLEDAAVECDRMLRDDVGRDGKPAEYWARAVISEQRRRATP